MREVLGSMKCEENTVVLHFFVYWLFSLLFSVVVLWDV